MGGVDEHETLEWSELDLEPDVPEVVYTLIGRITVVWARLEEDLVWQSCVEADAGTEADLALLDKKALSPRIEERAAAFVRFRLARIGDADGPQLDQFRHDLIAAAAERARLVHGTFYTNNGALMVRHRGPKQSSNATHNEVDERSLQALLAKILEVHDSLKDITARHRRENRRGNQ